MAGRPLGQQAQRQLVVPADHAQEDMTGVMFRDPMWLGAHLLTPDSVWDYLALSQFWEPSCNNNQAKMQRLDPAQMRNMIGIEYTLDHAEPPQLFVFTKRYRHGPSEAEMTALAQYYVLGGSIFQTPDLHAVLSSYLRKAVWSMHQAFQQLSGIVEFDPSSGFSLQGLTPVPVEDVATAASPVSRIPVRDQKLRIDALLHKLRDEFPIQEHHQPAAEGVQQQEGAQHPQQ